MRKRTISFVLILAFAFSIMVPYAFAADSGEKAIYGRPTLKIEGTTAYCAGIYSSGNNNDSIYMTITLKQGNKVIRSWSASGNGSVTISKTCTVTAKQTYSLTLTAKINGQDKPSVTVTATGK